MELKDFINCCRGELLARVSEGVEVHVSVRGPTAESCSFVLLGTVGRRPFDHLVDGELVSNRSEDWGRSLARGLAIITVQGD